jgi:hypothetical protein
MCYYVTLGLSDASVKQLGRPARRGMSISQYDHPRLRTKFSPGCSTWLLTSGGCSCDLFEATDGSDEARQETFRPEPADFIESLVRIHGPVYLFVHFYSESDITAEKLKVASCENLPLSRLKQKLSVDRLWRVVG